MHDQIEFTRKARNEIKCDHLDDVLIKESLKNALRIEKTLNSNNPFTHRKERLYIIKGRTFDGLLIYTKGKFKDFKTQKTFYVLISSKKSL